METGGDRTLKCPCCENTKLHFVYEGDPWSMMGEESCFERARDLDKLGPSKIKNNKIYYKQPYMSKFDTEPMPSKIFCKCGYSSTDIKDF